MRTCVIIFIALASLTGAARGDNAGSAQEQAACRPDVRKLCGHIRADDSQKYKDCLQAHFSELSQKCQQVLMNHHT
jgi:hypothetical protein